jgi:beta-galactosidase
VAFEPGELSACARVGGRRIESSLRTHGAPVSIAVDCPVDRIRADGRDISYVTVRVVDDTGIPCLTWNGTVNAAVDGAGRRAGPPDIEVAAGTGRFVVRSTGQPGPVHISVTGGSLAAAAATIVAE